MTIVELEVKNSAENNVCMDKNGTCPMLLTAHYGTAYQCRLYTETFGSKHESDFLYQDIHRIHPHKKCNEAVGITTKGEK